MRFTAALGASTLALGFALTATGAATAAPESGCHPSYTPCVPYASDVDCKGGSGNGPAYTGRVQVIGPDEYDLDRDGDGIACEKS
ncbi:MULTISPECIES: excalibur calcium-binding domain-containing protein [Nocardia]|uniref:Excalibur calcium-binding domain-containing protein n=1 Tax=Nocardia aurea TaxID=2144174 RepID=A0ABV3FM23_9NOCA|nr:MULTISPECIES: excalibur calcium-binding domain-containing protein [Nocardia]